MTSLRKVFILAVIISCFQFIAALEIYEQIFNNDLEGDDNGITTIESNDTGVGFLITVDGLTILHPGDHANRQRDFSGNYLAEIDFLKAKDPEIDISFMPIRGCGFGDNVAVKMGVYRTIEELKPKTFFPMHSVNGEYNYREFIEQMEADTDFAVQSIAATQKGDGFFFKNGKIIY